MKNLWNENDNNVWTETLEIDGKKNMNNIDLILICVG